MTQSMMKKGRVWRPPSNFIPAGEVVETTVVDTPAYIRRALARRRRLSGAKKAGMAFEKAVHGYCEDKYGDSYLPSLWFQFKARGDARCRTVQPDALHVDYKTGVITIVEIKLAHNIRAWWQLRQLYQPIVKHYFGRDWRYEVVEIYKWNRLGVVLPETAVPVLSPFRTSRYYKTCKLAGVG